MKRRRIILAGLGFLALGVVAALVWPREREPEYQGKKLSEWIRGLHMEYLDSNLGEVNYAEKVEAVRRMGTNALPFLVRWLDCGFDHTPSPTTNELDALISRIGPNVAFAWQKFRWRKALRSMDAISALTRLGAEASPAIPELVRWIRRPGKGGEYAEFVMGSFGKDGVPVLIACLTNSDSAVAATAALLLGKIAANPDKAVPALTMVIASTNVPLRCSAILALGGFGREAETAVPILVKMLQEPNKMVRENATNALGAIDPDALRKADGR